MMVVNIVLEASEMLVYNHNTPQHNPENNHFYLHLHENLKSYIKNLCGKAVVQWYVSLTMHFNSII